MFRNNRLHFLGTKTGLPHGSSQSLALFLFSFVSWLVYCYRLYLLGWVPLGVCCALQVSGGSSTTRTVVDTIMAAVGRQVVVLFTASLSPRQT